MAQTKFNTTQLPSEAETFFNGGTGTHTASDAHIASTANPHTTTAAQVAAIPNDGWISVSWSTPTRTSASVFTVAVDVTGIIAPAYKLKFTDTTTKYAVVKSVTYGAGVSTITIFINTDYTIVGNPSAISWSNIEEPFGWPDYFAYTPTTGGITMGNGTLVSKYKINGKTIIGYIYFTMGSTSAITGGVTFTAPVANTHLIIPTCWLQDSGTNTFAGLTALSSSTFNVYAINAAGTYMSVSALSSTVPYTWAVNDFISIDFDYGW
jgi:hypothetical protein